MSGSNQLARVEIAEALSPVTSSEPPLGRESGLTRPPDARLVEDAVDAPSEEMLLAWRSSRWCVECGRPIRAIADAALLVPSGRLTHRERCFVDALIRLHPLVNQLAARKRAREVHTRSSSSSPRRGFGNESSERIRRTAHD